MTREQLWAQIVAQEEKLARRTDRTAAARGTTKLAKDAQRARRAKFKLEAQKRARLGVYLNRYHC